jgi:acyl phosphate:glycerol-3-phosphate acyltransferase
MHRFVGLAASCVVGYVLGLTPSAQVVAFAADGTDIRRAGTGNPGALNVSQVVGTKAGVVVLMADVAKGFVAGRVGGRLAGATGANAAASAAVIGHCFPATAGFRGGKGVATSVGQVLATFPGYFPLDFAVAASVVANRRLEHRTFAANSVASVMWVAAALYWWRKRLPNPWGPTPTIALPLCAALTSGVITARFLQDGPVGDGEPT